MGYEQHYSKLFQQLENEYGKLDPDTIMAIIGFSVGGPVNMCERKAARLFVTCELSVYDEQKISTDGLKFEFFSKEDFDEEQARAVFTALGGLSMQARLGNNHTVDLSGIEKARTDLVSLQLHSTVAIEDVKYGLYRVRPAQGRAGA